MSSFLPQLPFPHILYLDSFILLYNLDAVNSYSLVESKRNGSYLLSISENK